MVGRFRPLQTRWVPRCYAKATERALAEWRAAEDRALAARKTYFAVEGEDYGQSATWTGRLATIERELWSLIPEFVFGAVGVLEELDQRVRYGIRTAFDQKPFNRRGVCATNIDDVTAARNVIAASVAGRRALPFTPIDGQ